MVSSCCVTRGEIGELWYTLCRVIFTFHHPSPSSLRSAICAVIIMAVVLYKTLRDEDEYRGLSEIIHAPPSPEADDQQWFAHVEEVRELIKCIRAVVHRCRTAQTFVTLPTVQELRQPTSGYPSTATTDAWLLDIALHVVLRHLHTPSQLDRGTAPPGQRPQRSTATSALDVPPLFDKFVRWVAEDEGASADNGKSGDEEEGEGPQRSKRRKRRSGGRGGGGAAPEGERRPTFSLPAGCAEQYVATDLVVDVEWSDESRKDKVQDAVRNGNVLVVRGVMTDAQDDRGFAQASANGDSGGVDTTQRHAMQAVRSFATTMGLTKERVSAKDTRKVGDVVAAALGSCGEDALPRCQPCGYEEEGLCVAAPHCEHPGCCISLGKRSYSCAPKLFFRYT